VILSPARRGVYRASLLQWVKIGRSAISLRMSAKRPQADASAISSYVGEVPCVDGSLLARHFFTVQLIGCGHVFGLFTRFT